MNIPLSQRFNHQSYEISSPRACLKNAFCKYASQFVGDCRNDFPNTIYPFYTSRLIPQIHQLIFRVISCQQTEQRRRNKAYLWPRSKCWIRASRASIQHAATKVTNMLYFFFAVRQFRQPS